jgi:hypothetical protein
MPEIFTTKQIGELLGVDEWRVRRLYESRRLPEPARFAGRRAIPREDIPVIVDALRERGWLPSTPMPEASAG